MISFFCSQKQPCCGMLDPLKLDDSAHGEANKKTVILVQAGCHKGIPQSLEQHLFSLIYVGQTLLRIKDRFKAHFYSIEKPDLLQVVARHFADKTHNGILDVKAPRSPAAAIIRDRVERRWMNLLRTCAPKGLNIED